tara:strand:+ start:448 stop:1149 length:702 start_codon:yes stop_codon:yes gene_type:complete
MDPTSFRSFMAVAGVSGGPEIGDSYQGGFFAGYISQNANGTATHGLIVAPASSGYNGGSQLKYKTDQTADNGATSSYDGAANTTNIADSDHPAANYCAGLSIGGYSDWYLPARYELEIAYYYLKPTTENNHTGTGTNSYAVPSRSSDYTSSDPARTSLSSFQSGNTEAFLTADTNSGSIFSRKFHWTSTSDSGGNSSFAWYSDFNNGRLRSSGDAFVRKDAIQYVRAFRKFSV